MKDVNVPLWQENLVEKLVRELEDSKSRNYYWKLVRSEAEDIIRQALEDAMHADRMGLIRTTKPRFFMDRLKRYAGTNETTKKREEINGRNNRDH